MAPGPLAGLIDGAGVVKKLRQRVAVLAAKVGQQRASLGLEGPLVTGAERLDQGDIDLAPVEGCEQDGPDLGPKPVVLCSP